MPRFDEIELTPAVLTPEQPAPPPPAVQHAPRFRRLLALLTDLSLFVALALALSPLLPPSPDWTRIASLAGFVTLVSYYYFAGTWLLWGKSIGGAIFDVRIAGSESRSMSMKGATLRWTGVVLSLLTGGLGFLLALLPSRLSLADRISGTRSVASY